VFSDKAAPPELPIVIDHIALKDILGPPLFEMEVSGTSHSEDESSMFRVSAALINYMTQFTVPQTSHRS